MRLFRRYEVNQKNEIIEAPRNDDYYLGKLNTAASLRGKRKNFRWEKKLFCFVEEENRWFQIHHHGSIDDPELLHKYKNAVSKINTSSNKSFYGSIFHEKLLLIKPENT